MLSGKKTLFPLCKAASFGICLVFLIIFFSQFAIGAEENISISGIKFIDANSNRIFDQPDKPLIGYEIYIDRTNTGQFQQGDPIAFTDNNGKYEFINISKKGFVREYVSSSDQYQPSYPPNGYNLADVTDSTKDRLDFANSNIEAARSTPDWLIWAILGLGAILGIIGAGVLLLGFYYLLGSLKSNEIAKDKRTMILITSGFVLLILGLSMAISGAQMFGISITGVGSSFSLVIPVVLTLLVFGAVLAMLYAQTSLSKQDGEAGGMRKTIAGLLVVGLIAVVLYALNGQIQSGNKDIITQYVQLVGVVIAFYFGSKATSDAYKGAAEDDKGDANKDLEIKNVTYNANEGQIVITGSNKNKRAFDVMGVYIDDGQKPLIDKTIVGVGVSEALLEFPVTVAGLTDGEKTNMAKITAGQKYNITIKTTMGDKTTQCEIVKN